MHTQTSICKNTLAYSVNADGSSAPIKVGGLANLNSSTLAVDATGVDGNVDSWHAGVYALRQSGPFALRLGAAYSGHQGESKRTVAFNGFSDRPKGDYDDSQQAFAELGYAMGSGRLSAEPLPTSATGVITATATRKKVARLHFRSTRNPGQLQQHLRPAPGAPEFAGKRYESDAPHDRWLEAHVWRCQQLDAPGIRGRGDSLQR